MAKLEVIHDDSNFIVVNKLSGLISEKNPYEKETVENQVFNHLLKQKNKPYVGVIHRLDRVTSGVLMFAKKKSVLVKFNTLFSSRNVQKTYLALVKNKPIKAKGQLVNFLVKNTKDKKAEIVKTKSKEAQQCSLLYRVIGENKYGFILEVKPKTGRFHQIRAQLAHIGSPIIGDDKYGSNEVYLPLSVCLHAWKLTFEDAETKQLKTFEAALPKNKFWEF